MNTFIIKQLEHELNALKSSSDAASFEKHLYAIETIAKIGQNKEATSVVSNMNSNYEAPPASVGTSGISAEELRMMGAKVPNQENRAATDDGFGNGDSIFDF